MPQAIPNRGAGKPEKPCPEKRQAGGDRVEKLRKRASPKLQQHATAISQKIDLPLEGIKEKVDDSDVDENLYSDILQEDENALSENFDAEIRPASPNLERLEQSFAGLSSPRAETNLSSSMLSNIEPAKEFEDEAPEPLIPILPNNFDEEVPGELKDSVELRLERSKVPLISEGLAEAVLMPIEDIASSNTIESESFGAQQDTISDSQSQRLRWSMTSDSNFARNSIANLSSKRPGFPVQAGPSAGPPPAPQLHPAPAALAGLVPLMAPLQDLANAIPQALQNGRINWNADFSSDWNLASSSSFSNSLNFNPQQALNNRRLEIPIPITTSLFQYQQPLQQAPELSKKLSNKSTLQKNLSTQNLSQTETNVSQRTSRRNSIINQQIAGAKKLPLPSSRSSVSSFQGPQPSTHKKNASLFEQFLFKYNDQIRSFCVHYITVLILLKRNKEASKEIKVLFSIGLSLEDTWLVSNLSRLQALLYIQAKKYEEASLFLKVLVDITITMKWDLSNAISRFAIGYCKFMTSDYSKSKTSFKEASKKYTYLEHLFGQYYSTRFLFKLYSKEKKEKDVIECQEKLKELNNTKNLQNCIKGSTHKKGVFLLRRLKGEICNLMIEIEKDNQIEKTKNFAVANTSAFKYKTFFKEMANLVEEFLK